MSAVGPSLPAANQRPWFLRKRSSTEVLRCPDLLTLRQWIVERRIARDDEISRSGQRWRRMGSVVELESLFYSAEQERAHHRRTTGQFAPVVPTSGGAALNPRLTPVPTQAAAPPSSGPPGPISVPTPTAPKPELRAAESVEAKKSEPVTAKNPEPTAIKKPEITQAPKSEPAPAKKPEPPPAQTAVPAASDKKPPESGSVGTVKVTPPPGLGVSAGGLSPMRLARKDPNRGKPQAMPGMAGSVQAAMRAAGTPAGKPDAATGIDTKRPESGPVRTAPPAGTPVPRAPAATGKPASGHNAASGLIKGDPADSGDQTALFARAKQDQGSGEDTDVTRQLPSADARTTDRQKVRPRDAVEDAILRNDPVPRHLKEAAEGTHIIRKPSKEGDSAEFSELGNRSTSRLGIVLLLFALFAVGGGTWFYLQHGDTPVATPTGDTTAPVTGSAPVPSPDNRPPTPGVEPVAPVPVVEPLKTATGTATPTGGPAPAPIKPEVAKVAPGKPEPTKPVAAPLVATPPAGTEAGTPAAKPTLDEVRKKIGEDIPKGFDDQMELAQRLVEHYKYDSAQALYEYMLTYASAVPAIHNGLGTCAFEKNRGDEAIEHYRNALTRRPSYSAAVFGLAKTYHRLKNDKEQALVFYKKYLELSPKGSAANLAREAIAKLEGHPAAVPLPAPPAVPEP